MTYVGHVDHFGVGVAVNGDSIYNGAHDNASGVSIVLETAKAFTGLPTPPRRSVLFLIVTAEEWGLLGSDYFVEHPTVPRESLVANFSLDMPFLFHPLLDIVPYGADHTSMGDAVATAAAHMGLGLGPDPIPEQVLFIRSDHFSFIRHGIPALFIKSGFETGDERDGGAINTAYRQERYHTPFDDMSQDFDFAVGGQPRPDQLPHRVHHRPAGPAAHLEPGRFLRRALCRGARIGCARPERAVRPSKAMTNPAGDGEPGMEARGCCGSGPGFAWLSRYGGTRSG